MSEILSSCWSLLVGLGETGWGLLGLVSTWVWEMVYHLHVSSPRLEGLLVGVALAWLMLRRDRHPLLRVLSAPLKLILDILDLGWDQVVEVCGDLWDTVRSWAIGSLGWLRDRATGLYGRVMGMLRAVKDKLARKKND